MHHFKRFISTLLTVLLLTDTFGLGALGIANAASSQATTTKAAAITSKPVKYDPPQPAADPNWAEIDWDSEVVLPQDVEEYQKSVSDLVAHNKSGEVKNLKQKKHKLSEEGTMQHFRVPALVQKTVLQYTKNGKTPVSNKEELKYKIKSLDLPVQKLPQQLVGINDERVPIVNIKNAKPLGKKVIPYIAPKEKLILKDFKILEDANKRTNTKFEFKVTEVSKVMPFTKLGGQTEIPADNGEFWDKIKLFFIPTARAQNAVPLIGYYDGIHKNPLDLGLYYISTQQNADGSFGKTNKFVITTEIVYALVQWGKGNNDSFANAIDFLLNYEPETIEEKAFKIRIISAFGQNIDALLGDVFAAKNDDGGYGFKDNYKSDVVNTLEVLNTLTAIQYNADDKNLQALSYVLSQIHEDGSMHFTGEGDASYYLVNKTLSALYPF
ncbi:MAG: hypothetical protein WCT53_05880, partial [Candidatus Gracilibacteria bacterium]